MKPENNARKKVEALERRKALLDALIEFIKAHPKIASQSTLHSLYNAKTGLQFAFYALIVPTWNNGRVTLQLVKSGEDWLNKDPDGQSETGSLAEADVSGMSDAKLKKLLRALEKEANE